MSTPLDEADLVRRFRAFFPASGPVVRRWAGDDAAHITDAGGDTVSCVDLLVEGVHFRLDWSSPADIGYKSVAVNYSDLASCGAEPRYILLGLAAPLSFLERHLDGFYAGIVRALNAWGGEFAGGDYTRSDRVFISVTSVGGLPAGGAFWGRNGAAPGQNIWISGLPGEAALGLRLLSQGKREGTGAQRAPDPPLPVSRYLRDKGIRIGACCDTSDGLSSSLHLIAAESGCRLSVDLSRLPLPDAPDAMELALHGGEDYGLLFTTSTMLDPDDFFSVTGIPVTPLGTVVAGEGVFDTTGRPLPWRGYDHLA